MINDYEFKNDKYDIIGFNLSKNVEQYDFAYKLGDLDELCWGFNINGKLIGVSSYGNYLLDSYSALVDNADFYILSDFDLYRIYRNPNGEYSVKCQVIEQRIPLIELTVTAPTEDEAETIANNWTRKNQELYAYIMSQLL